MAFDTEDKLALGALLKRAFHANNRLIAAAEAKRQADEIHAGAFRDFEQKRSAFAAFGFEVGDPEFWARLRAEVGEEAWDDAYRRSLVMDMPPIEFNFTPPWQQPSEPVEVIQDDGASTAPALSGVPSVRDVVLSQLSQAGDVGTTAAQIRTFYEKAYGRELHEKTVGMTLYRLTREKPPKAKRLGRTWYMVPSSDGAKNPGGGTPGHNDVFE